MPSNTPPITVAHPDEVDRLWIEYRKAVLASWRTQEAARAAYAAFEAAFLGSEHLS